MTFDHVIRSTIYLYIYIKKRKKKKEKEKRIDLLGAFEIAIS